MIRKNVEIDKIFNGLGYCCIIQKKLEFGNYTLKFGSDKVLLDLFEEVVMPSFQEMNYVKRLKDKGEYFFLDTKLVVLDDNPNVPVIGMSSIKTPTLKRKSDWHFNSSQHQTSSQFHLKLAFLCVFVGQIDFI